jgi:hypothetical protein
MWLVRVEHHVSGDPTQDRQHYECQACEAKAVLPPLGE